MKWYQNDWVVLVFVLIFPPAGLFLAFKYDKALWLKVVGALSSSAFLFYAVTKDRQTAASDAFREGVKQNYTQEVGYDTAKVQSRLQEYEAQLQAIEQEAQAIEVRYNEQIGVLSLANRQTIYAVAKQTHTQLEAQWLAAQNLEAIRLPTDAMNELSKSIKEDFELSLYARRQRCELLMKMADAGDFSPSAISKLQDKNTSTQAYTERVGANLAKLKSMLGL